MLHGENMPMTWLSEAVAGPRMTGVALSLESLRFLANCRGTGQECPHSAHVRSYCLASHGMCMTRR